MSVDIPECCGQCNYQTISDKNDFLHCSYNNDKDSIINPEKRLVDCPLLDEVLDAKRFRVKYRGEDFYVTIAFLEGKPREVFAEHPTNQMVSLHYMLASWDACTRLASMALKVYPLHKVINQLKKSSRQENDLPDILKNLLSKWEK